MGIYNKIKTLDGTFSWSFFGFLIGILGFAYAFYLENIKKDYAEISYEIISNTNVLDLKENIGNLDVIYNQENILKTNRNLKVLTVRISNTGTKDITQNDFEQNQKWGFKIENASIVNKPKILNSTNKYLESVLKSIRTDTLNNVYIPKIIIESKESFTLKILTISDNNKNLYIKPFGKIAGIKTFEIYQSERKDKELSFVQKIIFGNFWIHIARFFFYIFSVAIFSVLFGLLISSITDFFENKKIKKNIEKYKRNSKLEINDKTNKVFDIYINYKESFVKKAQSMLSKEDTLKSLITLNEIQLEKLNIAKAEDSELFEPYRKEFLRESMETYPLNDFVIKKLKDYEIISFDEQKEIKIDNEFIRHLNDFVYFLKLQ